jgi:hypothetical protein
MLSVDRLEYLDVIENGGSGLITRVETAYGPSYQYFVVDDTPTTRKEVDATTRQIARFELARRESLREE